MLSLYQYEIFSISLSTSLIGTNPIFLSLSKFTAYRKSCPGLSSINLIRLESKFKDFSIISDDTNRLTVSANGNIVVHKKLVVSEGVSIGVKNPGSDVDLTVAGSVRLEGKKFEVSDTVPGTGNYKKGDIVWHANPTAYVGWICMKSGSPGEWKKFGKIVS